MEADDIIRHFDLLRAARPVVTQLAHEEDGEPYRVWKLDCGGAVYLLKEAKEYEAQAGGGVVMAKVSGKRELLALTIDPEAVDPDDVDMLQDLIVAAVNEAMRKASDDAASQMSKLTGGLNLPF